VPGDAKAEREMVDLFTRKRDVLYGHCQDIGRDPSEITVSAHVFLGQDGPGRVANTIASLAERGLDVAIVYVPVPHDPGVLAPLAETLAPLRRRHDS
jgi:hypothetical protein